MIGRATFLVAALLVALSQDDARAATLHVVPTSGETDPATGTTSAFITVDDPVAVAIYRLGISYDAAILDATAEIGAALVTDPPSCAFATNDSVDGKLCIYVTCFPPLTANGLVLANLHLSGNMTGTSLLTFDATACADQEAPNGCFIGDESELPLSCLTVGGSISVVPTVTQTPTATSTPTRTATLTATSTPTPSATTTPPAMADLAPAVIGALPGGIACLGLNLSAGAVEVASVRTVMNLGATSPFTITTCELNPLVGSQSPYGKQLAYFIPQPRYEEVDIFGTSVPLPDGALFSCTAEVSADASVDSYPISNTTTAFDPQQHAVPGLLGGATVVKVTSCSGDCDGDGQVSIADVQRCVAHFLGQPLCSPTSAPSSCPAADTNHNGRVSMSETSECVNHFLGGCD